MNSAKTYLAYLKVPPRKKKRAAANRISCAAIQVLYFSYTYVFKKVQVSGILTIQIFKFQGALRLIRKIPMCRELRNHQLKWTRHAQWRS